MVIAITVSSVNPRAGRSGNLVFALFAFVVYFNLLNLGQSWISSGRVGFATFVLALHGGVLAGRRALAGQTTQQLDLAPAAAPARGAAPARRA